MPIDQQNESAAGGTTYNHKGSSRYIVVFDGHPCGSSLTRDLRPYCPQKYLDEFDQYAVGVANNTGEATLGLVAKLAEVGASEAVLTNPQHPHTRALPASCARPRPTPGTRTPHEPQTRRPQRD